MYRLTPLRSAFILLLLLVVAAFVVEPRGDEWEEYVRDGLYALSNDSVPNFAQEFTDDKGIPYVYYPEQNGVTAGLQYNPTIVCNYALQYYEEYKASKANSALQRFYHCVQWLQDSMARETDYALFRFYWQQPWYTAVGVPYTSGMTSGLAIEVFGKAWQLQSDPQLLHDAQLLLNGYYVPIDSGGFTYKHTIGWWYEELADTAMHSPYILDGHIFATTGVYHLWKWNGNDSAKFIFDKGIAALKHYLPQFDAGNGQIYYDKHGKLADKKYRRILTRQMQQLYALTGDEVFNAYYKKWVAPLQQPYVYRIVKEANRSGLILFFTVASVLALMFFSINLLLGKTFKGRR